MYPLTTTPKWMYETGKKKHQNHRRGKSEDTPFKRRRSDKGRRRTRAQQGEMGLYAKTGPMEVPQMGVLDYAVRL